MTTARRLLLAGLLLAAACGDGDDDAASPTSPTSSGPAVTTTAPPATSGTPATSAPAPTTAEGATTTPAVTTLDTTTTTVVCSFEGDDEAVSVDFPMGMSSLVGTDIRVGGHDCFERVVIEFGGQGTMPGYRVRYEPDDQITDSPRGEPVELDGDATLVISAAAWMPDMEGNGYAGPSTIDPTNVTTITELVQLENFEGMFQWAVGLDRQHDFTVDWLTDPPRLVVDIATG